ncbi:hypothetical protein FPV67DRAFT_1763963 [Lyophyllum atratum]|nr:hypothetical protein FPV67DRAFT_1763963 [Lyophyllum atratum]
MCVPNLVLAAGLTLASEETSETHSPRDSRTRHPSQIGDDMIFWNVSGLRLIVPGSFVIPCLISIKPVSPSLASAQLFYGASAKYCRKECQFTAWSEEHLFWCSAKEDDDAARAAAAGDAATGAGIPVVQAQAGPSDPSQGHVRWAERAGDGWGGGERGVACDVEGRLRVSCVFYQYFL